MPQKCNSFNSLLLNSLETCHQQNNVKMATVHHLLTHCNQGHLHVCPGSCSSTYVLTSLITYLENILFQQSVKNIHVKTISIFLIFFY